MDDRPAVTDSARDLLTWLEAIWRRKLLVLGLAAITFAASLFFSYQKPARYTSTAKVWVKSTLINPLGSVPLSTYIDLATESAIVDSLPVAEVAAPNIGIDTAAALGGVSVSYPPVGAILYISFTSDDPTVAQRGAQAFAEAYLSYRSAEALRTAATARDNVAHQIAELKAAGGGDPAAVQEIAILQESAAILNLQSVDPGEILLPAGLPSHRAGSGHKADAVRGLILGIVIGVAAALFQERVLSRRA